MPLILTIPADFKIERFPPLEAKNKTRKETKDKKIPGGQKEKTKQNKKQNRTNKKSKKQKTKQNKKKTKQRQKKRPIPCSWSGSTHILSIFWPLLSYSSC